MRVCVQLGDGVRQVPAEAEEQGLLLLLPKCPTVSNHDLGFHDSDSTYDSPPILVARTGFTDSNDPEETLKSH